MNSDEAFSEAARRIEEASQAGAELLDLSGLGLTSLPDALYRLSNLEALNLEYNRLTSLSDSLGLLGRLTGLYLSSNQLSSLPKSLCELGDLEVLDVSENRLRMLPDGFGQLGRFGDVGRFVHWGKRLEVSARVVGEPKHVAYAGSLIMSAYIASCFPSPA